MTIELTRSKHLNAWLMSERTLQELVTKLAKEGHAKATELSVSTMVRIS